MEPINWNEMTIPRVMRAAAERFGTATALEEGDTTMSFEELAEAGLGAARAFLAAGLEPGDRVAVWAPNIHEWIVAALGLQAAGGVMVPLNTRMRGGEAGYILSKGRVRMLCTVTEFLGSDYLELLRDALGGANSERPVAGLEDLERIIVLRSACEDPSPALLGWSDFLAGGESVA